MVPLVLNNQIDASLGLLLFRTLLRVLLDTTHDDEALGMSSTLEECSLTLPV